MKRSERKAIQERERQRPPERSYTAHGLLLLPPIDPVVLDYRDLEYRKDDDGNACHFYSGPLRVGMVFAWEPDLPHARELLIIVGICDPKEPLEVKHSRGVAFISRGNETQIWSMPLDSPHRGEPFTGRVSPLPYLWDRGAVPNDEGRFREAVIPTLVKDQTP